MKYRIDVLIVAVVIMLVSMAWMLVRPPTLTITASSNPERIPLAAHDTVAPMAPTGAPSGSASSMLLPTPPEKSDDRTPEKNAQYTAVRGDTLSNIAIGLLGRDSNKNRDAVIAANPSLQANPDRVLDGQTYTLVPPVAAPVQTPTPESPAVVPPAPTRESAVTQNPKSDRTLKYIAQPGDNVAMLAAGLLGADSKTNRDAIISENKSLQRDPNVVIAGKSYTIPGDEGLAAAPVSPAASTPPASVQPDADQVVKNNAGRELRYTARAGDNVSKLAEVLLGSNTPENRDAIINNNASLKSDPDHVVAGQTYWIPAPTAAVQQP